MGKNIHKLRYTDRTMSAALVLGTAALVANAAAQLLFPEEDIQMGSLFLFWSAAALGPFPTLIAAGVGVFPEAFYFGNYVSATRTLLLAGAVSYVAVRRPRIPMFIVTAGVWLAVLWPVLLLLNASGMTAQRISPVHAAASGLAETMLAMISGTILLNRSLWGALRHQPRRISISDLLLHVIPLTVTVILCITMSVSQGDVPFVDFGLNRGQPLRIAALVLLSICAATLLAWRLAVLLERDLQQYFAQNLLQAGGTQSFSGLASDYWRRHSAVNVPRREPLRQNASGSHPASNQALPSENGICALNRNKTFAFLNTKFRLIMGILDNDPLGKAIDAVGMREPLARCLNRLADRTFQKGPKTVEIKLNDLPDKLRFIEISSQYAAGGPTTLAAEPDNIIITARDITDRRTVEHNLLRGQRLASLSHIIKGLAHAFNNALAAIIGSADAAQYACGEPAVKKSLEQIAASARRAGLLARQLLDFADGAPGESRPGDLTGLIAGHLDLFRKIVGERTELTCQLPSTPVGACYEPNLVLQAVTNLIVNAKEAVADNPAADGDHAAAIGISLGTEDLDEEVADLMAGARPGSFARLSVSDNGAGMNPEVLAHAFDPLFTTKSRNGNTGLGLPVVYGIARSLDGFLSVESHVGRGTTVSIYLPLANAVGDAPDRAAGRTAAAPPDQTPDYKLAGKILVVEDDQHVREVVAGMLGTLGYEVSSCSNGRDALQRCAETGFDLVLTDMVMPQMSGAELIAALRKEGRGVKALIMTAYGVTGEAAQGGARVLAKPFDMNTLAQAVQELLDEGPAAAP